MTPQDKTKHAANRLRGVAALLLTVLSLSVNAQNRITVKGTVVDSDNVPLIGVSVLEKGTTNGIQTDPDGNYTLTVPSNATLTFICLGFNTEDVAVNGKGTINLTMTEEALTLDDVVVVGYGVQKKSDVTGAISQVKSTDIMNRPITDATKALQGKTSGVQMITTSGIPGAESTIRIRGYSSNGSSDPLYVVDGLRVKSISQLDPNSIESMEVLKDAASAAIYGAEAGNGVIMITTKTGSKDKVTLSYSSQFEWTDIRTIPDVMNAQQYVTKQIEYGEQTQETINALIATGYWDGKSSTDWSKYSFETGFSQRHTVSADGGSDKGQYFLSLSYNDEDGMALGNNDTNQRFTGTVNGSYKVTRWLRVGNTTNFYKTYRRSGSDSGNTIYTNSFWGGIVSLDPTMSYTYPSDNLPANMQALVDQGIKLKDDGNGNVYSVSALQSGVEQIHPMIQKDCYDSYSNRFGISGTLYGEASLLKGLTVTSRLGYRFNNSSSYSYANYYYGNGVRLNTTNNSVSRSMNNTQYYQWENFVNYNTKIAGGDFTAMAGMAFDHTYTEYLTGGVSDVQYDDPLFADVSYPAADASLSTTGYYSEAAKLSYFARAGYNYKNKYYVQASFRADAADLSKLSKQNRWGYFPAVSGGWTISNEDFFPKVDAISSVKLRASWGQNGSTANLSGYPHSAAITTTGAGFAAGTKLSDGYYERAVPNQLANPNLTWETSEQLDLGLDAKFLANRLTFTMDWYKKETKDLLISGTTIPLETGNSAPTVNAGNVMNKGFEFELGWRDQAGDFSYSINGNLATLDNEVTYLDPTASGTGYLAGSYTRFTEGLPVWHYWLYQYDGVDENGIAKIVDQNGDGKYNNDDRIYFGTGYGKFTYGVTVNLAYRGFDIIAFGTGSYGNKVFNHVTYSKNQNGYTKFHNERWSETDPTALGIRPRYQENTMNTYYNSSDAFLFDGSYFKIKQLQLGYTLPSKVLKAINIKNLRVYASLDDWFCLTPYFGTDPEVAVNATTDIGVDTGSYPNPKRTILGINITF